MWGHCASYLSNWLKLMCGHKLLQLLMQVRAFARALYHNIKGGEERSFITLDDFEVRQWWHCESSTCGFATVHTATHVSFTPDNF